MAPARSPSLRSCSDPDGLMGVPPRRIPTRFDSSTVHVSEVSRSMAPSSSQSARGPTLTRIASVPGDIGRVTSAIGRSPGSPIAMMAPSATGRGTIPESASALREPSTIGASTPPLTARYPHMRPGCGSRRISPPASTVDGPMSPSRTYATGASAASRRPPADSSTAQETSLPSARLRRADVSGSTAPDPVTPR